MIEILTLVWENGLSFLVMLTILVFVHEMGHFSVARFFGVTVETFSVGFGRALVNWKDKAGTDWKIGWIPLGGYVKFLGDEDATSVKKSDVPVDLAEGQRMFHEQPLYARAAVVAAGPAANFIFAIAVLSVLFATLGQSFTPAVVDAVIADTAASDAGVKAGDRIIELDGQAIERFEELQLIISSSPGIDLEMTVLRDDVPVSLNVTPRSRTFTDRFDNQQKIGFLGVSRSGRLEHIRHGPVMAIWYATRETWHLSVLTLKNVWRMIVGEQSADGLRGPIGIAKMSGQAAQMGFQSYIGLMVIISISLGLINLFPVPILDGGHLAFYIYEAIFRRPPSEKAQEIGFRIGFVLVICLMLFATRNDFLDSDLLKYLNQVFS
jgi:regulator of sigma E protease